MCHKGQALANSAGKRLGEMIREQKATVGLNFVITAIQSTRAK
jgi:hypothetical protein